MSTNKPNADAPAADPLGVWWDEEAKRLDAIGKLARDKNLVFPMRSADKPAEDGFRDKFAVAGDDPETDDDDADEDEDDFDDDDPTDDDGSELDDDADDFDDEQDE